MTFSLAEMIHVIEPSGSSPVTETKKHVNSSFKLSNKQAVPAIVHKKSKSQPKLSDIEVFNINKIKYFENLQKVTLPKKKADLLKCKNQSKREKLEQEINDIQERKEEVEYLLTTSSIVNEYVETMNTDMEGDLEIDTTGKITKYINKYDNVEKDRLVTKFYKLNGENFINTKDLIFDNTTCTKCGGDTEIYEGFQTCTLCGVVSEKSVGDFQISYKNMRDSNLRSNFSYKRVNRFTEILQTLQAKESTDIPETVMEGIREEIIKEQLTDLSLLDKTKIKGYLKRINMTRYYEHTAHIITKLNGIPPLHIPPHIEEEMKIMFKQIQDAFEIVKVELNFTRTNFLSYYYTLYKFSELLHLDYLLPHFPLLKSVDKLRTQDLLWKGITEILGWQFIPTV